MKKIIITVGLFISSYSLFSQNQTWNITDLNTVVFRNGDSLFQAKDNYEWLAANKLKVPACILANILTIDSEINIMFYNWYVVNDKRGLAPDGYHIPSENELLELVDRMNNDSLVINGLKLNRNGIFTTNGKLKDFMSLGCYWLSSPSFTNEEVAKCLLFQRNKNKVFIVQDMPLTVGSNIRCIKD